jgi:hypothetical protein
MESRTKILSLPKEKYRTMKDEVLSMPYVTAEQIERAKQMDLLTYLQSYEPHELVRFCGNVYTTRTHDSLKISNGKWCWWSRDIGGRSALDYLIKVRGIALPKAVIQILGQAAVMPPVPSKAQHMVEIKRLLLPEKNENNNRVIAYLIGRGIHREIIEYCIQAQCLYESRNYHNAVFVGFDAKGTPRYAAIRGTSARRYMGEANGSDKHYSFSIPAKSENQKLHLFESAIDLLSYCTLELLLGRDWRQENHLSLAGIYKSKEKIEESTLPAALMQYLKDYPHIKELALHLDNDTPGRLAAKALHTVLSPICTVTDEPPGYGKDMNDSLRFYIRLRRTQEYLRS